MSVIREARRKLGISQTAMARLLGITRQSTISDYETGKLTPSRAVQMLAAAYADGRLPIDWNEKI